MNHDVSLKLERKEAMHRAVIPYPSK